MIKKIESQLRSVNYQIQHLEESIARSVASIKKKTEGEDNRSYRYDLVTFLPSYLKTLTEDMEKMNNLCETKRMLEYLLKDDEENAE